MNSLMKMHFILDVSTEALKGTFKISEDVSHFSSCISYARMYKMNSCPGYLFARIFNYLQDAIDLIYRQGTGVNRIRHRRRRWPT